MLYAYLGWVGRTDFLITNGQCNGFVVIPLQPGRFHDDQFLWMRHEVMNKFLFESPAGEIAKRMTRSGSSFSSFLVLP